MFPYKKAGLNQLYFCTTNLCNLSCRFCYSKKQQPPTVPRRELSLADCKESYLEYKRLTGIPVQVVEVCGMGEATMSTWPVSDFANFVMEQGTAFSLQTNGQVVDRGFRTDMGNKLCLGFSLDGLEEAHDWARGKGSFKKVLAFADYGVEIGAHLCFRSLVTAKNNCSDFLDFIVDRYGPNTEIHFEDLWTEESDAFKFGKDISYCLPKEETDFGSLPIPEVWWEHAVDSCCYMCIFEDRSIRTCCDSTTRIGTLDDIEASLQIMKEGYLKCSSCKIWSGEGFCPTPFAFCQSGDKETVCSGSFECKYQPKGEPVCVTEIPGVTCPK